MEKIGESVDQLAKDLASGIDNKRFRINLIWALTQPFPPKFFKLFYKDQIYDKLDIYDFAKKCHTFFFFNRTIRLDAKELINNINDAVISTFHSIYLPRA